jgi:hypothetical protein
VLIWTFGSKFKRGISRRARYRSYLNQACESPADRRRSRATGQYGAVLPALGHADREGVALGFLLRLAGDPSDRRRQVFVHR